jgi:hypothetical protein
MATAMSQQCPRFPSVASTDCHRSFADYANCTKFYQRIRSIVARFTVPVGRIPLLRPRRALPSNFVVVPRSKSFTCRPIAYRMSLSALYRHNCGPFAPTASNPQVPAGYCGYVLDGVKSISARSFHCRRLPIVVRFLSSPPGRPHQTIVIQRCAQSITHWLANMSQKMPKSRWLFSFGGMAQTALTQFLNGPMEYLIFTNSSSMKYSSL